MIRQYAVDVEEVINKYAGKFGLKGFANFECSLMYVEGGEDFTIQDGKKHFQYRCYGTAIGRNDNVYLYFTMLEDDYTEITARDMAFKLIGVACEEVSKRLQGVINNV